MTSVESRRPGVELTSAGVGVGANPVGGSQSEPGIAVAVTVAMSGSVSVSVIPAAGSVVDVLLVPRLVGLLHDHPA